MYDFLSSTLNLPFRINLSNLTEIRHTNGAVKRIRRVQQAPYPLIKVSSDVELFDVLDNVERSTNIIVPANLASPKQLPPVSAPSKSKKLFPNLVKLKHTTATANDTNPSHTVSNTSSSSSGSSSSKLARQIFNNLNIFSNKQHQNSHNSDQSQNSPHLTQSKQQSNTNQVKQEPVSSLRRNIDNVHHRRLSSKSNSSTASTQNLIATRHSRRSYRSQDDDLYLETDGDSSCYSTNTSVGNMNAYGIRRPSVDTISTYLSHESNERLHYGTAESTYTEDDDVFLPSHKINGSIVGVDPDSDMISRFVNVVHPEWPKCRPCVICLEELQHNPNNPAVSLIRCEHLMHLNCLNHLIITQSEQQHKQSSDSSRRNAPLYIECPVCGIVYGEKYGNQPPGTMTWSIIAKQVAGHEGQNTIQIVYK